VGHEESGDDRKRRGSAKSALSSQGASMRSQKGGSPTREGRDKSTANAGKKQFRCKFDGNYADVIMSQMDSGDMSRSGKYQYMMKGGQNKYNHFRNFNEHIKNSSVH